MSIRARLPIALATGLAVGLLAAPGPASSRDEQAKATPARSNACAAAAAPARCLVVPAADRLLADHGAAVGEPYDEQGNLLDRHGYVIAVPGTRGAREVFVTTDR